MLFSFAFLQCVGFVSSAEWQLPCAAVHGSWSARELSPLYGLPLGLLPPLLLSFILTDLTAMPCCQCQATRTCVRCSCKKAGKTCTDCYPSRSDPSTCCNNSASVGSSFALCTPEAVATSLNDTGRLEVSERGASGVTLDAAPRPAWLRRVCPRPIIAERIADNLSGSPGASGSSSLSDSAGSNVSAPEVETSQQATPAMEQSTTSAAVGVTDDVSIPSNPSADDTHHTNQ